MSSSEPPSSASPNKKAKLLPNQEEKSPSSNSIPLEKFPLLRAALEELIASLFQPDKATMEVRYGWSRYLNPTHFVSYRNEKASPFNGYGALNLILTLSPLAQGLVPSIQEEASLDALIYEIEKVWEQGFLLFPAIDTYFESLGVWDVRYKWAKKLHDETKQCYDKKSVLRQLFTSSEKSDSPKGAFQVRVFTLTVLILFSNEFPSQSQEAKALELKKALDAKWQTAAAKTLGESLCEYGRWIEGSCILYFCTPPPTNNFHNSPFQIGRNQFRPSPPHPRP